MQVMFGSMHNSYLLMLIITILHKVVYCRVYGTLSITCFTYMQYVIIPCRTEANMVVAQKMTQLVKLGRSKDIICGNFGQREMRSP